MIDRKESLSVQCPGEDFSSPGWHHTPGSFGLTHVPVIRASLLPAAFPFRPSKTSRTRRLFDTRTWTYRRKDPDPSRRIIRISLIHVKFYRENIDAICLIVLDSILNCDSFLLTVVCFYKRYAIRVFSHFLYVIMYIISKSRNVNGN